MFSEKWQRRFVDLAGTVAGWSKDPSTKVGAVIVRPDKTVASLGFNGFPRHLDDERGLLECREVKYRLTVHAEMNAVLSAKEPLRGYALFLSPLPPCERCAVHLVQTGLSHVYAPPLPGELRARWEEEIDRAAAVFRDAGVRFQYVR